MIRNDIEEFWATIRSHPQRRAGLLALLGLLLVGITVAIVASRPDTLPDFREFAAGPERKDEFFGYIHPLIEQENQRILRDRERLTELRAEQHVGWLDGMWVRGLADEYGLDTDELSETELVEALLRRVDIVPDSLALAQAAKESGWGTSRFAQAGNNLFGEWCFDPGCGIVPQNRAKGRSHEVQYFRSPAESIRSYLRNLNTHDSYKSFRAARAKMRSADRKISGPALAEHLSRYSERRLAYVEELKSLIRSNDLASLDAP